MRVCYKCGYVDSPYWRHSKFSSWIDITETENLKLDNPELVERLLKGEKIVEDKYYYYRITKTKLKIHRKAKVDFCGDWVDKQEKAAPRNIDFRSYWKWADPKQTKL